jgi:hypothetical protein
MNAYFAAALIVLAILSPGFQPISGMPALSGVDLVLGLFLLFLFPFYGRRWPLDRSSLRIRNAFMVMGWLALVSIALSPVLYGTQLILNDWMILPMLFRYYLIFRVAQSVRDEKGRGVCIAVAILAFTLSAAVGILQFHNLLGVNSWLTPYYSVREVVYGLQSGRIVNRIGGTHGDSRRFGFLLVCGLSLLVSVSLTHPKQAVKLFARLAAVPVVLALFYTLSRTTALAGVCVLSASFFFLPRKGAMLGRAMALVFSLGVLGFIVNIALTDQAQEAFQERVLQTDTISFESSTHARTRDLKAPFLDALENPAIFLVGRGPAKAAMKTSSHNDFGWYFHRFGLPGLIFYLSILIWGLREAHRRMRRSTNAIDSIVFLSSILIVINWTLFAMAEDIWKDGQIMAINMFFLGLAYAWSIPANATAMTRPASSNPSALRSNAPGLRGGPVHRPAPAHAAVIKTGRDAFVSRIS